MCLLQNRLRRASVYRIPWYTSGAPRGYSSITASGARADAAASGSRKPISLPSSLLVSTRSGHPFPHLSTSISITGKPEGLLQPALPATNGWGRCVFHFGCINLADAHWGKGPASFRPFPLARHTISRYRRLSAPPPACAARCPPGGRSAGSPCSCLRAPSTRRHERCRHR